MPAYDLMLAWLLVLEILDVQAGLPLLGWAVVAPVLCNALLGRVMRVPSSTREEGLELVSSFKAAAPVQFSRCT